MSDIFFNAKPPSYIAYWTELRMWLIQARLHGHKITTEDVLIRMDEIELDAYKEKNKKNGVQREETDGGEG